MKFYDIKRLTETYGIWAAASLIDGEWMLEDSGNRPAAMEGHHELMRKMAEALHASQFDDLRTIVRDKTILASRFVSGEDTIIGVVIYDTGDALAKSLRRLKRRCMKPRGNNKAPRQVGGDRHVRSTGDRSTGEKNEPQQDAIENQQLGAAF